MMALCNESILSPVGTGGKQHDDTIFVRDAKPSESMQRPPLFEASLPGCHLARVIKQSNVTLTRETILHIFRVLPGFKINDHGHGACLCSHFSPKSPEQQQLGMYHHHST